MNTDALPRVDPSTIDGQQLVAFLDSNPTNRVGRYFETLVLYYLQHVLGYEIIASQQPIKVDGRTVGEIDFLYRDHAGLLTHLEVAVKFYLHLADRPHNGSHFVGPNSSDTFESKIQRLFEHQLPLSEVHCTNIGSRAAMIRGRIYYRGKESKADNTPNRLARDHLRGTWMRASEFNPTEYYPGHSFQILQKPHWLTLDPNGEFVDGNQLSRTSEDHFASASYPLHVAVVENRQEVGRLFIIADSWPNESPR